MLETQEHDKDSEKEVNEIELSNLPDSNGLKSLMGIKMHSRFERRVDELSDNLYKEIENIKKNQL